MSDTTLTIPYLPIDPFAGIRLPAAEYLEAKWKVLERLGIDRRDDATPLVAWRDAIADRSGVPRAQLDGNLDLMFAPRAVRDFAFFLA